MRYKGVASLPFDGQELLLVLFFVSGKLPKRRSSLHEGNSIRNQILVDFWKSRIKLPKHLRDTPVIQVTIDVCDLLGDVIEIILYREKLVDGDENITQGTIALDRDLLDALDVVELPATSVFHHLRAEHSREADAKRIHVSRLANPAVPEDELAPNFRINARNRIERHGEDSTAVARSRLCLHPAEALRVVCKDMEETCRRQWGWM